MCFIVVDEYESLTACYTMQIIVVNEKSTTQTLYPCQFCWT